MAVEMQDVMQAAVDAQRAGDTQKAQQYKALYQKYSQPQQFAQAGPEVIEPNFGKLFDDGPIDYSIDNAQKLYGAAAETVGRATGVDSLESYGQNVQAQQDVDIQKGNYQSAHPDDFIDIWKNKGLTGVLSALPTKMAENVTTTGAALIGAGVITAASAMGAPASLLIALKAASGANLVALGVGEVTQEQKEKLGDFDPALSLGGGAIIAFLERIGAGGVIPKSKLVGMTAPQITAALAKAGKTSAVKKFATAMASEGLTESAQELVAIGSAAAQGADYTGREVAGRLVDSGVLGAAYGGTFNAAGQTAGAVGAGVNRAGTALANMDSLKVTDEEAASTFAKRLETIATANKWDLTDIDRMSTTGARHILDQAHVQLSTALVHKFNDVADKVKASDRDSIQEVEDKIMAAAGYRQGKNKTKNTVGVQEYAAFEKLAGDTLEGQEALALMRELDQLTVLHNAGYQAGLSRITDQLAPFGSSVGYDKGAINSERLLRPIVSGQAALMSGGLTLAAQSALWGAGRLADKATGNRSRIATYVDTYKSKPGIAKAKGFSVRKAAQAEAVATEQEQLRAEERAAQTAADKDAANRDLNQRDSEPTPTSPQDTVQRGTGLSKQKVAKMLRILKNDQNLLPFYQKLINEYETSVDTGGKISDFLLIRRINTLVDSNVTLRADRTNPPDRGVIAEAGGTYIEKFVSNYERGRADNIRVVNELRDQLNADTTLSNVDKAVLLNTVDKLLLNLGSDPVGRIGSLMKRLQIQGVPDAAIQKYVGPYFERVASQQAAKADKDAAVLEVKEAVERPDAAPAPAPVAPQAQVAPQAPAPVLALPGLPAPAGASGVLTEQASLAEQTLVKKKEYEANPNSAEAREAYLTARTARDAAGDSAQPVLTQDYRMLHTAPVSADDAPLSNVEKAMPDFYSRPSDYKTGSPLDRDTLAILREYKNHPDNRVRVYRAVPLSAPDVINYGDWVTVNKKYAALEGASIQGDYKIIDAVAAAKDIKTNGDSIHEFGYAAQPQTLVSIYHSTNEIFDEFDNEKSADNSVWFSDNQSMVQDGYEGASGNQRVMTRYIDESKLRLATRAQEDVYTHGELRGMGFDGVKYADKGAPDVVYQIYYPEKLENTVPDTDGQSDGRALREIAEGILKDAGTKGVLDEGDAQ